MEELSLDVGSRLLFEDDRCRVWLLSLQGHEASNWHRHETAYVYVAVTAGEARTEYLDGAFDDSADEVGTARLRPADGGHRLINLTANPYENIVVELKDGGVL